MLHELAIQHSATPAVLWSVKQDKMELSDASLKTLLRVLATDCFKSIDFSEEIVLCTKMSVNVDSLTEFEYDFTHKFIKSEMEDYTKFRKEAQTQTEVTAMTEAETQTETIVTKMETECDEIIEEVKSKSEPVAEVKVEVVSEDDNMEEIEELGSDDVTKVIPESPDEPRKKRKAADLQTICPLCPAKFGAYDVKSLEEHLKISHDIGNEYSCPMCPEMCNSKVALADHVTNVHCKQEPQASIKKGRIRKKVPKKIVEGGSDTDEGYMKKEELKIKINSKGKKVIKATKKKKRKKVKKDPDWDGEGEKPDEDKPKVEMADPDFNPEPNSDIQVRCKECGKEYRSRRALRRHFNVSHTTMAHVCEICGHSFRGKESLYHHKRGIHENAKVYKCPEADCGAEFNFSHSLRLHRLKHSGARPHMCNVCGKTYLTNYHLKVHMTATHSEKKNFSCKICSKSFSYSTSLKMHEATHRTQERVKCDQCDKTFVNNQALKYHFMSKHATPGIFPCPECDKVCKSELLLKTHMRRHSVDNTRFMCDVCGRQFMYKSALEMHRAIHKDDKSFVCKTCGKAFKTYPTLYSHQYVHKVDSPYTCSICGKTFKTKERLKAHEKRHSGLKPFECNLCHHCFPDKGGLSKHMKTVHCNVKKFVCDICGKATSRADNLRVHMKVHMKGTDYTPKKPREAKENSENRNMPSMIMPTYEDKERMFDDEGSNSSFVSRDYEPNMPHFSTIDGSHIATTTGDQNMPLNLHQQASTSSQSSNIGSQPSYMGNHPNQAATPPPASMPPPPSNNFMRVAGLNLYSWPYLYNPGVHPGQQPPPLQQHPAQQQQQQQQGTTGGANGWMAPENT
ncbi:ZN226-like protein [Mya arenaria]|uniref:ZN226-like protein n=2 Tax=Mya arenaria TaxID=6604 RepID=A0ABY7FJM7_MYAAR|nr:ZN226-like protein [Mya arenaria]